MTWKPELPADWGGISQDRLAEISADVKRYRHGLWAEELKPKPTCCCGITEHAWAAAQANYATFGPMSQECPVHAEEVHRGD